MSDEDNEDSKNGAAIFMIELFVKMVTLIKKILEADPLESAQNQFQPKRMLPLGKIKLRAIELLQAIVSLKKA